MKSITCTLFNDIIKCPSVESREPNSPCKGLIASNLLPEPWNSKIEEARILFVGANPGVTPNEEYPDSTWTTSAIEDYFENRFYSDNRYVKTPGTDWDFAIQTNGKRCPKNQFAVKLTTGAYKVIGVNAYWSNMHKIASNLLSDILEESKPEYYGDRYAITEIAHCKTKTTKPLSNAAVCHCADKFMNRILAVSINAKIIVAVGDDAASILDKRFGLINSQRYKRYNVTDPITNKEYIYFKMYHPSKIGTTKEERYDFTI